jgi:hypothetical protein
VQPRGPYGPFEVYGPHKPEVPPSNRQKGPRRTPKGVKPTMPNPLAGVFVPKAPPTPPPAATSKSERTSRALTMPPFSRTLPIHCSTRLSNRRRRQIHTDLPRTPSRTSPSVR